MMENQEPPVTAVQQDVQQFVHQPLPEKRAIRCHNIVLHNVFWAVWTGVIPSPLIDMGFITAVQAKMANELAYEYDVAFSKIRTQTFIISLLAGTGTGALSLGLSGLKLLPGFGTGAGAVAMSTLGGAITYAIGKVFIKHFEAGGDFSNLDASHFRAYFREKLAEGKAVVKEGNHARQPGESSSPPG